MKLKVVGVFIAIRALSIAALALIADSRHVNLNRIFNRWDAQWYRRIAEDGYGYIATTVDGRHLSDYAFFPLYPMTERLLHKATSMSLISSGILISAIAAVAAALGIFLVVEKVASARIAYITVILWAALPVALVQSIAYSESLFTALAVWALYFTLKRQYFAASILAALAGATRPIGLSVALAVIFSALIQIRKSRATTSALFTLLIAPLGWLGYVAWVGKEVGSWNGYFKVADGWENNIDGGRAFAQLVRKFYSDGNYFTGIIISLGVLLLLALLWKLKSLKIPTPILIYTASIVILSLITSGYFGSKPRYLLPAFPLLIPIAQWISHLNRRRANAILGLLVLTSITYGSFWLTGSGPL